jgi:hypothetical protein
MRININRKYSKIYRQPIARGWEQLRHIDDSIDWKIIKVGVFYVIYEHPTDKRYQKFIMYLDREKTNKQRIVYMKDVVYDGGGPSDEAVSYNYGVPPELKGMPTFVSFWDNGNLNIEEYRKGPGDDAYFDDLYEPSVISYNTDGGKHWEVWYANGEKTSELEYQYY